MTRLQDCPVCAKLASGSMEVDGDKVCLVVLEGKRVAALKDHIERAAPSDMFEACKLLRKNTSDGILAEYADSPGHWALQLIHMGDMK